MTVTTVSVEYNSRTIPRYFFASLNFENFAKYDPLSHGRLPIYEVYCIVDTVLLNLDRFHLIMFVFSNIDYL